MVAAPLHGFPDAGEIGVARGSVEEREAVEQQRGAERAEQEVLERTFRGARRGAAERGHRVGADRHRLEAEEHGQRITGRRDHHGPDGREEHEHVELAALELVLGQVSARQERRQDTTKAEKAVEEEREAIDDQPRGKRIALGHVLDAVEPKADREREGRGEDHGRAEREPAASTRGREDLGEHQHHAAEADDEERGEEEGERHVSDPRWWRRARWWAESSLGREACLASPWAPPDDGPPA